LTVHDGSSDRTWVQEYPDKPLTLHTSPADVAQSTITRLISVVEILKREYLKTLDASAGQLTGLHQYNELQWEQRGEIAAEGEDRASSIARALEGEKQCVFQVWKMALALTKRQPEAYACALYESHTVQEGSSRNA
jgi:hypothetical protein